MALCVTLRGLLQAFLLPQGMLDADHALRSRTLLGHLTSRWGVLVLLTLRERTHRFGELGRALGHVSEKMLAQTLNALERDGFVLRVQYPELPLRVEYSLSAVGKEGAEKLFGLTSWVENHCEK